MSTQDTTLPPLPDWSMRDDLGGLVPSDIRSELKAYARAAIAAQAQQSADLQRRFDSLLAAEHALSDSYVRIREIIGAMNPPVLEPAALYAYVEDCAKTLAAQAQQPSTEIDEEQLKRLWANGAKAWAGVDAQALRDGYYPVAPQQAQQAQGVPAEFLPVAVSSAPHNIWLDLGFDPYEEDAHFSNLHKPTWSEDNASGCGIKYVRADLLAAAPQAEPRPFAVGDDPAPNDWRLPADLKAGHVTFRKGVHCSALVSRMKALHETAFGVDNLTPEQKAENLAALQACKAPPHDFATQAEPQPEREPLSKIGTLKIKVTGACTYVDLDWNEAGRCVLPEGEYPLFVGTKGGI